MGKAWMFVSDFVISIMWAWSGGLIKEFVSKNIVDDPFIGEIVKIVLDILNMFIFAFLGEVTNGSASNPIKIITSAVSGDSENFLYCFGARIPAQVLGSIVGVKLIIDTIPEAGRGPRLNVDIHQGALTEGLLTFVIVTISLGLAAKIHKSFFMKTWISSLSKLTLHILGSDLTGGCMNPASVMGWAYARGEHISKEHILVYWLAPIEATILAVWTFKLLVRPEKEEKTGSKKSKED